MGAEGRRGGVSSDEGVAPRRSLESINLLMDTLSGVLAPNFVVLWQWYYSGLIVFGLDPGVGQRSSGHCMLFVFDW